MCLFQEATMEELVTEVEHQKTIPHDEYKDDIDERGDGQGILFS